MKWRPDGSRTLIKLEPGDRVVSSLLQLARERALPGGLVRGIGAVKHARIGFYRPDRKAYDERELSENLEVVSLMGNLAHGDEGPILHAHVALGRSDLSLIGGHLFEATVSVTLEVAIDPTTEQIERAFDSRFDLNLLRF